MTVSKDTKDFAVKPVSARSDESATVKETVAPCEECFPRGWPVLEPGPRLSSVGCEHGMWTRAAD